MGVGLDLAITASDPNGDPFTYSATGLPNGLSINASTGHITGTPNTVNVYAVTVTATDNGTLSGSANFNWTISNPADVTAPTTPTSLAATTFSATQINLGWSASTDNVGVTGYQIERCQGVGCSNFTPLTTVTTTAYSNIGLDERHELQLSSPGDRRSGESQRFLERVVGDYTRHAGADGAGGFDGDGTHQHADQPELDRLHR